MTGRETLGQERSNRGNRGKEALGERAAPAHQGPMFWRPAAPGAAILTRFCGLLRQAAHRTPRNPAGSVARYRSCVPPPSRDAAGRQCVKGQP